MGKTFLLFPDFMARYSAELADRLAMPLSLNIVTCVPSPTIAGALSKLRIYLKMKSDFYFLGTDTDWASFFALPQVLKVGADTIRQDLGMRCIVFTSFEDLEERTGVLPSDDDDDDDDVVKADAVNVDAVKVDAVKVDAVNADAVKANAVKADAVNADVVGSNVKEKKGNSDSSVGESVISESFPSLETYSTSIDAAPVVSDAVKAAAIVYASSVETSASGVVTSSVLESSLLPVPAIETSPVASGGVDYAAKYMSTLESLNVVSSELSALKHKYTALESTVTSLQTNLRIADKRVSELNVDQDSLTKQNEVLESEKIGLARQNSVLTSRLSELELAHSQLRSSYAPYAELEMYSSLASIKQGLNTLFGGVPSAPVPDFTSVLGAVFDTCRLESVEQTKSACNSEIESLTAELTTKQLVNEQLQASLDTANASVSALTLQLEAVQKTLSALQAEKSSLLRDIELTNGKLVALGAELDTSKMVFSNKDAEVLRITALLKEKSDLVLSLTAQLESRSSSDLELQISDLTNDLMDKEVEITRLQSLLQSGSSAKLLEMESQLSALQSELIDKNSIISQMGGGNSNPVLNIAKSVFSGTLSSYIEPLPLAFPASVMRLPNIHTLFSVARETDMGEILVRLMQGASGACIIVDLAYMPQLDYALGFTGQKPSTGGVAGWLKGKNFASNLVPLGGNFAGSYLMYGVYTGYNDALLLGVDWYQKLIELSSTGFKVFLNFGFTSSSLVHSLLFSLASLSGMYLVAKSSGLSLRGSWAHLQRLRFSGLVDFLAVDVLDSDAQMLSMIETKHHGRVLKVHKNTVGAIALA